MTLAAFAASAFQLGAGIVVAPLLPGVIQSLKARLQGRRGPSPLQPYRELRRLWGKSRFHPLGTTVVYAAAPAVVAASLAGALLVLAPAGTREGSPLGHDVILLVGLLALARFALGLSAWDTGSGFALMGAARDLIVAVGAEGLLMACLALAVLAAGSTDLVMMAAAADGPGIWLSSSHWCALTAFALVIVTETGRQPVDNPDTHLELTMIHEGPLLEYSGRDLAYLQWAAAARHLVVLVLGAELFLPHGGPLIWRAPELMAWIAASLVGLAFTETLVAKMRLLRIPVFLGSGLAIAGVGMATWFLGIRA